MRSAADAKARGLSLRARVALALALVAAVVGLGAGFVAARVTGELALAAEAQRLREAAQVMENELAVATKPPGAQADDEAEEIAPLGIRLALFANGARLGGDEDVAYVPSVGCAP